MDKSRVGYLRRTIGLSLGLSPVALFVWSLAHGLGEGQQGLFIGVGFVLAGLAIGITNFHFSFIRPHLHFRRHKSMEDYHFVSGVPILGTLFAIAGGIYGFGAIGTACIGILAVAIDTGGSVWFIISTWRDESLWDS